jgi:hypothetical protein
MPTASRDDFLRQTATRRYTTFTCPVSGLVARIQSLTEGEESALDLAGYERDKITEELLKDETGHLVRKESAIRDSRPLLILATVVDDEGKPLFSEADLALVKGMDSGDSIPLFDAIKAHCRGKERDAEKKNPGGTDQLPPADAAPPDGSLVGGVGCESAGGPPGPGTDGSVGSV